MHHGIASAALKRDGLWLGRDQLARQRLLVGTPQFVLLAFERGGHVFGLGRWRRWNDGERAAIRAFELVADIFGAGEQPRVANAAVETDVLGHHERRFLRFGRRIFYWCRLDGRRRDGKRQGAGGAAGSLADHRSRDGEGRSAPGASDDGSFRLSRGHRFPST